MKVSFNGVCRGEGKIYAKVTAYDVPEHTEFRLAACSEDGRIIPCRVATIVEKKGTHELALIAPILQIAFSLRLEAVTNGKKEEVFSKKLDPFPTRWESRLNHKLKKSFIHEVLSTDVPNVMERLEIKPFECIEIEDFYLLRCLFFAANAEDTQLKVAVYDEHMNKVECAAFYQENCREESIDKHLDPIHRWACRIRIPRVLQNYLIVVSNATSEEILGFHFFEKHILQRLIDGYYNRIRCACTDGRYPEWFNRTKAVPEELRAQRKVSFEYEPQFSVIVPLYKTPPQFFDEMVASVLDQSYSNLELILVNASPQCEDLTQRVREVEQSDSRVRTVRLEENLGITENTNAGIAVATGDFLSFFDHDDTLELNLFYEYAKALNEDPEIDLLYCDEDKLNEDGFVCEPVFKPNFNYDLLRTNNYICHLLTVRKSIVDTLDPSTKKYDGAQDYNMALRVIEKGRHVGHIEKVLYHWRKSATSTAGNVGQKNYADDAGLLCVQEHLARMGFNATSGLKKGTPFIYRTQFVPQGNPLVSIVIPTCDQVKYVSRCVQSILDTSTYGNFEIILVENNSADPRTFEYYQKIVSLHGCIKVATYEGEFNFSKIVNYGVSQSSGEYVFLLNNDIEVKSPDCIERMLGYAQREDIGAVGAKLLYADGTIQCSGIAVTAEDTAMLNRDVPFYEVGYLALIGVPQNIVAVTGACMLVSRAIFDSVGGFSEDFPVAFNDIDFCMKVIGKGYENVQCNDTELYHHESISRGLDYWGPQRIRLERERAKFNATWAEERLGGNKYLNRNVDQSSNYLALPPREKWPHNPFLL